METAFARLAGGRRNESESENKGDLDWFEDKSVGGLGFGV